MCASPQGPVASSWNYHAFLRFSRTDEAVVTWLKLDRVLTSTARAPWHYARARSTAAMSAPAIHPRAATLVYGIPIEDPYAAALTRRVLTVSALMAVQVFEPRCGLCGTTESIVQHCNRAISLELSICTCAIVLPAALR